MSRLNEILEDKENDYENHNNSDENVECDDCGDIFCEENNFKIYLNQMKVRW